MAVDKSYGSGKSRTAANSSARRRVAAGKLTKSKKSPAEKIKAGRAKMAASPLGQLADTVLGFALPVGKVKAAAAGLRAAGKIGQATALEARVGAKLAGKSAGGDIAAAGGKSYLNSPMGKFSIVGAGVPTKTFEGAALRGASRKVFPDAPKKGSLGGLEFLPGMTKTQAAAKMLNTKAKAAYRARMEGTRVTELEKRLRLPAAGSRAEASAMAKLGKRLARQDNPYRKGIK